VTVVCIASGPSLTHEDCELVRQSGYSTIVTNTTFRMCPWAHALFGFDIAWWRLYLDEVRSVFRGRLICGSRLAPKYGLEGVALGPFRNSGACAAAIALREGARRVVLLGFDAGLGPNGETHHHGDHPAELRNVDSIGEWPHQFAALAKDARRRGAVIVNASRRTALTCFPRVSLADALELQPA
jgi:hypothetical protein